MDHIKLSNIIKILGEEKDARRIASEIIKYRAKKTIEKTEELVAIIRKAKKNYQKTTQKSKQTKC